MEVEHEDGAAEPRTMPTTAATPGVLNTMSGITATTAAESVDGSKHSAPDVDMSDLFYFDVARPSKDRPAVSEIDTQQHRQQRHGSADGPPNQNEVSKKRKSPGPGSRNSETQGSVELNPSKRARLDVDKAGDLEISNGQVKDRSLLPPEVWHHIFTFCPPRTLGNLLQVNKLFHHYLSPSSSARLEYPRSAPQGVLGVLKPHSVWQASRRLFWPHMPAPLRSMSELAMWRLLCSKRCQECDELDARDPELAAETSGDGPGMKGVSVIWPLGIRVCGPCLLKVAFKEIDLLLSPTFPSVLLPALPFTHITKELSVVSLSAIEQGQLPPGLQTTKLFLASDVEELKKEFSTANGLGTGTMEEWLKGLPQRGQGQLNETRKWEKWASSGHHQQVRTTTDPYRPYPDGSSAAVSSGSGDLQSKPGSLARQERTVEEVGALKASRKLEIERRAALLDPSIPPNVLQHMSTFQAAIQITTPLDESAWDVLQPRLLAERVIAEQSEAAASARGQTVPEIPSHLEATLASTKAAKDAVDQQWEEIQAPLRAQIVGYADEVIRDSWDNGDKVNKDNCCRFAAEALVHIRKRFYSKVAKEAAAARAAGKEPVADPPEGPFTQKLTLENMKWIFEAKIKPLTQPFKKEIFFCNGCPGKPFGFEGVNQHYAAKHTSAMSSGNIVVHWRAEWPEVPPFNPEGRSKPTHPGPGVSSHQPPPGIPARPYAASGYQPHPLPVPPPPGQPYAPTPGATYPGQPYTPQSALSAGPTYPGQPYAESYDQQYPGYQPPPVSYPPPPMGAPAYAPQPQHEPQPSWAPPAYNPYQHAPPPPNAYPPPAGYQPTPTPSLGPSPYSHPAGGYGAPPQNGYGATSTYGFQLDSIVRDSRDVWNATANIKDLPGSVRVQTTIFHVVKRFRSRFSETPSLAMFQDGLGNNKDMRPVRNINALICKACHLSLGNAASVEKDRASYSLPQLVNHFQSKHVELMVQMAPNSPPLDWTTDMVLLPAHHIMSKLPGVVGSEVQRRKLFADAFPEFFDQGPPPIPASNPYYGNTAQYAAPAASYQPEQPNRDSYHSDPFDNHEQFYGPTLNPPAPAPADSYNQDSGAQSKYAQEPYARNTPSNGYGIGHGQAPTHADHAHAASAPNPALSLTTAAPYEVPGRGESASVGQSPHGSRPPRDANKSGRNKNGRGKKDDDSTRAVNRGLCHRCSKPGHFARDCNKKAAQNTESEDIQVKIEEEEQRREEEIRAIWEADRLQVARVDNMIPSKPAAERQQRVAVKTTDQNLAVTGSKRTINEHTPQRRETPPQSRKPQPPPPAPQEQRSLLDALEMQLDREQVPNSQGQRSRVPSRAIYRDDGHERRPPVASDARRNPEPSMPQQRIDAVRYEQPVPLGYERARSLGHGYQGAEPPRRPPPSQGSAGLVPAEEHVYERAREPIPAAVRYGTTPSHRPDMASHGRDPYGYDGRYDEGEVAYERPPPQDYRPHPDRYEPLPPHGRPTGQLFEIVEVFDERGSYVVRRPIGFAPPRYEYAYEDEAPPPRFREAPPKHYEALRREPEPYHARDAPPAGYESGYPRGPQQAPAPPYSSRGRTQAPEHHVYVRGPPEHAYGRPEHQQHGDEYPVSQHRDPRQYGRPAPQGYEQGNEEYDPRNPSAAPSGGGRRGGRGETLDYA